MKTQRAYLDSNLCPIGIDGKIKSKEDRKKEHIKSSYGEKEPIPEAHPMQIKKFNKFLDGYQEDINKIVGKYRGPAHYLTHDELVSEVNLSFIKKRDELILKFCADFDQIDFRKLAFSFVRNVCRWTYSRIAKQSYTKRRADSVHPTEDGFKTTFEFAVDLNGEEDPFFEDFDRNEKCEYLMKMLKEYSGILTDKEIMVLSMLEKGMTQYEMSERLGVTRQAVSILSIKIFEKIRNEFSEDIINDISFDNVAKGHQAIKDFFSADRGSVPMESKDRPLLRRFLLGKIKMHTAEEISKKFLSGRYSQQQIVSFAVKNKLNFCLLKKTPNPISKDLSDKILKMYQEGRSTKEIAKVLKMSVHSIAGKRGHFTVLGLLTEGVWIDDPNCVAKTCPNFYEYIDALRLEGANVLSKPLSKSSFTPS